MNVITSEFLKTMESHLVVNTEGGASISREKLAEKLASECPGYEAEDLMSLITVALHTGLVAGYKSRQGRHGGICRVEHLDAVSKAKEEEKAVREQKKAETKAKRAEAEAKRAAKLAEKAAEAAAKAEAARAKAEAAKAANGPSTTEPEATETQPTETSAEQVEVEPTENQ